MAFLSKKAFLITLTLILSLSTVLPVYGGGNVLEKGDKSAAVKDAQEALRALGYFKDTPTGYFGEVTEKAVREFQKKYDLGVDGRLGPTTVSWLNKLAGKNIVIPSRAVSSRKDTTKVDVLYKVKKGDTVWDIANDYNVSADSILKANNLKEDSVLKIGMTLVIPDVVKVVKPAPAPKENGADANEAAGKQQVGGQNPVLESSEAENIDALNGDTYVVKDGDTLSSIAEDYGVTVEALLKENGLSEAAELRPGMELKVPEASDVSLEEAPEKDPAAPVEDAVHKGEYLDWFQTVQNIFKNGDIATVTDIETGKSFKVKRLYGRNHADVEPLTKEDTAIMKGIYGSWSWDRRAIIVALKDHEIAASMNGMPHGGQSIKNNNFNGQFCIHFKNSRTHKGNRLDAQHQAMVKKAAGL